MLSGKLKGEYLLCKTSVAASASRRKSHLNIEFKEPDHVVGEGEGEDDDDEEPAMALSGRLEKYY